MYDDHKKGVMPMRTSPRPEIMTCVKPMYLTESLIVQPPTGEPLLHAHRYGPKRLSRRGHAQVSC